MKVRYNNGERFEMKYQDFSVMVKAVGVWQDPTRGMMNHVKILIDK